MGNFSRKIQKECLQHVHKQTQNNKRIDHRKKKNRKEKNEKDFMRDIVKRIKVKTKDWEKILNLLGKNIQNRSSSQISLIRKNLNKNG